MNYVLPFLRNKRDQVSGYSNCEDGDTLYERFVEAFETKFPDEVDLIQKSVGDCGIKDTKEKPPSFWNQVVEDKKENVSFNNPSKRKQQQQQPAGTIACVRWKGKG
eukprot:Awhi_evm1s12438